MGRGRSAPLLLSFLAGSALGYVVARTGCPPAPRERDPSSAIGPADDHAGGSATTRENAGTPADRQPSAPSTSPSREAITALQEPSAAPLASLASGPGIRGTAALAEEAWAEEVTITRTAVPSLPDLDLADFTPDGPLDRLKGVRLTRSDRRFAFQGLNSGCHLLVAWLGPVPIAWKQVEVEDATVPVEFVIPSLPQERLLVVQLRDPAGMPVRDANLSLPSGPVPGRTWRTERDGRATLVLGDDASSRLSGARTRSLELSVDAPGFALKTISLTPAMTGEVSIALEPYFPFAIASPEDGTPVVARIHVSIHGYATSPYRSLLALRCLGPSPRIETDGTAEILVTHPGELEVGLHCGAARLDVRRLHVEQEDRTLDFDLPSLHTLTVRVPAGFIGHPYTFELLDGGPALSHCFLQRRVPTTGNLAFPGIPESEYLLELDPPTLIGSGFSGALPDHPNRMHLWVTNSATIPFQPDAPD